MPPAKTTGTTGSVGTTPKALAKPGFALQLTTVPELMQLADILWKGGANQLPGHSRPEVTAGVILAGNEIGLSPAQSIDTIMVCNGKRTIYGDGAMALVLASGLLEKLYETIEGDGEQMVAKAVVKRVGMTEETWQYSADDAKKAGLWEKKDNWKKDPKAMLTWRCRAKWQRGRFADVLRGLNLFEIVADDVPPPVVRQVDPPAAAAPASDRTPVPTAETSEPKQLAPATTAPTAKQAAGQVEGDGGGDGPLTSGQLAQLAEIQSLFYAGLNENDPAKRKERWVEKLAGYGVQSARDFTAAGAKKFIETEGPKVDPFRHPTHTSQT